MTTLTYSPEEVKIIWSSLTAEGNIAPEGLDLTDGLAEGTFITVSRDEDRYTKQVGANGKVIRVRNANRSGTVELTLMQQSLANIQLMYSAYNDDIASDQRIGNFYIVSALTEMPVVLQTIEDAWIKTMPDETVGKDNGERTWVFDAAKVSPKIASIQSAANLVGATLATI